MIPLSDDNPTVRPAVMTMLILVAIAAVWVIVEGAGFGDRLVRAVCTLGMVPGELTGLAPLGFALPIAPGLECAVDDQPINWLTPLFSMFLHGGWEHLLGNALFLWVFGNNIEDVMGAPRFLLFYLICGLAAAGAHVLAGPASPIPTVGASGAISGVMGAYFVLFPRVRVRMLFIFVIFFRVIPLPAWLVLLWWLALQVLIGLPQLAGVGDLAGGVAVWAHVGGFVAGALFIRVFVRPDLVEERRAMLLRRGLLAAESGLR
ncbi:MAG: rhomboid family intramembrane serine protease [Gemmatimonadetes bacterium]|nr:rhomboid family intramembrane serine protease [Gemmatimonadota bacterium]